MAIIVDKEQKRIDIALSCKDLFVAKGIKNITISQIAQEARVGKGTIYDYFKNKEDIVFEIVNILMAQFNATKEQRINEAASTKAKIKIFFDFFLQSRQSRSKRDIQRVCLYFAHPAQ